MRGLDGLAAVTYPSLPFLAVAHPPPRTPLDQSTKAVWGVLPTTFEHAVVCALPAPAPGPHLGSLARLSSLIISVRRLWVTRSRRISASKAARVPAASYRSRIVASSDATIW